MLLYECSYWHGIIITAADGTSWYKHMPRILLNVCHTLLRTVRLNITKGSSKSFPILLEGRIRFNDRRSKFHIRVFTKQRTCGKQIWTVKIYFLSRKLRRAIAKSLCRNLFATWFQNMLANFMIIVHQNDCLKLQSII